MNEHAPSATFWLFVLSLVLSKEIYFHLVLFIFYYSETNKIFIKYLKIIFHLQIPKRSVIYALAYRCPLLNIGLTSRFSVIVILFIYLSWIEIAFFKSYKNRPSTGLEGVSRWICQDAVSFPGHVCKKNVI